MYTRFYKCESVNNGHNSSYVNRNYFVFSPNAENELLRAAVVIRNN